MSNQEKKTKNEVYWLYADNKEKFYDKIKVDTKTGNVIFFCGNQFIHTTINDIYKLNKKLLQLEQENGNYKDIDENF